MKGKFVVVVLGLGLGLAGALAPCWAHADESPSGPTTSKAYRDGVAAVKKQDYKRAVALLEKAVAQNDRDADAYNMLGYSQRKLRNYDAAFASYRKALELDPKHRGAHEYIGEAYLEMGQLAKAKAHLHKLDELCFLPCEEYDDLKEAVEKYEASH